MRCLAFRQLELHSCKRGSIARSARSTLAPNRTADKKHCSGTVPVVSEAMFRASSLSALDPDWVDGEVARVLSTLTGQPWQRIAWVYLSSPIVESSVNIGGMASDVLRVRMGKSDVVRLAEGLQ